MDENFEALEAAKANSEAARKRFAKVLLNLAYGVLGVSGFVAALEAIPAGVWEILLGGCEAYYKFYVAYGLKLEAALALVGAIWLYKDCLIVRELRKYHSVNLKADRDKSNEWLSQKRRVASFAVCTMAGALLLAVIGGLEAAGEASALRKLSAVLLSLSIVYMACLVVQLCADVYSDLYTDTPELPTDGVRTTDSERRAREAGYTFGRFNDIAVSIPDAHVRAYSAAVNLEAYLDGVQRGRAMRIKLSRRGIDVDYRGEE